MTRSMRVALALALVVPVAANAAVDMQKVLAETRIMSTTAEQVTVIWWLPPVVFDALFNGMNGMTPAKKASFMSVLDGYSIFAAVRAKPVAGGKQEARPLAELLENGKLTVNGKNVSHVPTNTIKGDARSLLDSVKSQLAGALGAQGTGMEFLVYPSMKATVSVDDPRQMGQLSYTLYDVTLKLHLPLASMLPDKSDSKTGEVFPGNYLFNPYTGDKLADTLTIR